MTPAGLNITEGVGSTGPASLVTPNCARPATDVTTVGGVAIGASLPDMKIEPVTGPVDATVTVPGSKSHTNRAAVCAALAVGRSRLDGVLLADDTHAMIGALRTLGASIEVDTGSGRPVADIAGIGASSEVPSASERPVHVDVRQSGTTGRFLLAVLAALEGRFVLDGDAQLRSRPFGPQIDALRAVGADITGQRLPLTIAGGHMVGGHLNVTGDISSQFLSGLLLAAPLLPGPVTVDVVGELVSRPYVELTMTTMRDFGVGVDSDADFRRFEVAAGGYRAADVAVEPDASAASYFFGAAAVTGGRVRVDGLGTETVQGDIRFVELLERMGCKVTVAADHVEVIGPEHLEGIDADMSDISDTVQTMAVVASQARSPSTITGVGFIRNKETDRLGATAAELQRLGVNCRETADGLTIEPGRLRPATVQTYDDHRMAMSFSLLGLTNSGVVISDPGCVGKTFPRFFDVLDELRPAR